ncbi:MAG: PAS domain-containing protein [Rhodocyclaceae bacterium]|nr:PAS domain-containing protein [Rhodocyclaceae bacterium]
MTSAPAAAAESTAALPPDAAELAAAFAAFSKASEELSGAYNALQGQAAQLNERLNVLMAALPAGVVVLDAQRNIEQLNPAATTLLGALGAIGTPWSSVQAALVPTSDRGEFTLDAGEAGEHRLSLSQTRLESGEGAIVLLHDITETHAMRQMAERNERLAAMGEMVAGLAHQLRTPLSAALLYTAHLRQPGMTEEARERAAERTIERLRYLERLIRDMLLFARGDSLGRQTFPVHELVTELANTLEPVARARKIRFSAQCDCGETELYADRKALGGALTNLLENAIAATPEDGEVRFEATLPAPATVDFSVRDTGRGMESAQLSRIFEPFFTTRAEGTGLGLAIARGVARGHGGDIRASSRLGHGSHFVLTLPIIRAPSEEPAA